MTMDRKKRIALVAHDNMKGELLEWARFNERLLADHELCTTGITGGMLTLELGIPVTKLRSGPLAFGCFLRCIPQAR
jgi:methylglyoxal synthase